MLNPSHPPDDARRAVVTGCGVITAHGCGWAVNLDGFRNGRPAFRPITLFDTSRQRVRIGGQADVPDARDLPAGRLHPRQRARLDRPTRMLICAGAEALAMAGLADGTVAPWVLGTSAGAMAIGEQYYRHAVGNPGCHRGQAERVHGYQPQVQAARAAAALGTHGPATLIANACASGANAIGHAFHLVRHGGAGLVLAGGYDALSLMVFAGFDSLQALSAGPPRPSASERDGLPFGEAAAVVVVESLAHARGRGAGHRVLGEIAGYGTCLDVHHLTQPGPDGAAALRAMREALRTAGLTADEIDYLNAHGTGTPLNDAAEAAALAALAGAAAPRLSASSTKSSIGHLLGGAGAVEVAVCLMAMKESFLPPTTTVRTPDPAVAFDLVREPRAKRLRHVLTNSFGFGGATASLALRAPDAARPSP